MSVFEGDGSVRYPSQTSFSQGQLACGSIAYHWALACVHNFCKPTPSQNNMSELMEHAIDVHTKVVAKTGHSMLMLSDLLQHLGMPLNTTCREIFVMGDLTVESEQQDDVIELEDCIICPISHLQKCMQQHSALVFTANQHTTALFLDKSENLLCFDSLSGVVLKKTLPDMTRVLVAFHKLHNPEKPFEACAFLISRSKWHQKTGCLWFQRTLARLTLQAFTTLVLASEGGCSEKPFPNLRLQCGHWHSRISRRYTHYVGVGCPKALLQASCS